MSGVTGLGVPELVTARSAWPAVATVMDAVAALLAEFGSGVVEVMFAMADRIVPVGTVFATFMTTGKVAVPPAIRELVVQLMSPVVPGVGVVQVQPLGAANETKVAPIVPPALLAVGSVNTAVDAAAGP